MRKLLYAIKVLRVRGLRFFWDYFVESVWFDLRHGTHTFARVPKDEQTIERNETDGLLYVASFTSVTLQTVSITRKLIGPERFAKSQFFDLGCGKGKALLVFAKYFSADVDLNAVGIEYDPTLTELAAQNIAKCNFAKSRVEVVNDSATNLPEYVRSDILIIYLYNSFQGDTLRSVLEELRDIPHVLIYIDPAEKHILPDYDYQVHHENQGRYNADTWLVATSGLS